ncbi:hypothetical protein ABPG72_006013 [Tetrahymena utriculariae]
MSTCCQELPDIFRWKDVVKSGIFTFAFNALLLTVLYNNLGLFYVLTNFVLVSTVITIVYLAVLKFIFKAEDPKEDTQYVYVSEETVQGLIITFVNWNNCIQGYFKNAHKSILTQVKLIGGLYLLAKFVSCFSVISLTWLVVNGLLAFGFVSFKLGMDICGLSKGLLDKALVAAESVLNKIPQYTPPKSN